MIARLGAAALLAAAGLLHGTAANAAGDKNPLLGKWTITAATHAPWTSAAQAAELDTQAKKYVGLKILFTARTILSKDRNLRCRSPSYQLTNFPADALFQSSLPQPNQEELAQSLGFRPGLSAGVDVSCSAGLFSYHLRPDGNVLFAYDNVIYTLTKR